MRKTLDTVYLYTVCHLPRYCRIRIYEDLDSLEYHEWNKTFVVVIATMLWDHPGMGSVVNDAELLATEIYELQLTRQRCRGQRRPEIDRFEWYQHVPTSPSFQTEEFFQKVEFERDVAGAFCNSQRTTVEKNTVQRRVKEVLDFPCTVPDPKFYLKPV